MRLRGSYEHADMPTAPCLRIEGPHTLESASRSAVSSFFSRSLVLLDGSTYTSMENPVAEQQPIFLLSLFTVSAETQ